MVPKKFKLKCLFVVDVNDIEVIPQKDKIQSTKKFSYRNDRKKITEGRKVEIFQEEEGHH